MKPRAEYSTHSPTCVNPAGHLTIELRKRVIAPSPSTLFPLPLVCQIPLPMLECVLLFGGYPSCPRGGSAWPRAAPRATYYPASVGDIRPRPIQTARIFLERSLNTLSMTRYPLQGFIGTASVSALWEPAGASGHRRLPHTEGSRRHLSPGSTSRSGVHKNTMASTGTTGQPRTVRWVDGKRSKYVVGFVVIPLLIIAVLLLPPISAATRIADLGSSPISEAGGAIADPDGTQVVFMPGTVARAVSRDDQFGPARELPGRERGQGSAGGGQVHPAHPGGQEPVLRAQAPRRGPVAIYLDHADPQRQRAVRDARRLHLGAPIAVLAVAAAQHHPRG